MNLQRSGFIDQIAARDWTPVQICQAIAEVKYALDCRADALASHDHPVNLAMSVALDTAILAAYPEGEARFGPDFRPTVLHIWIDCGEPIAYCVGEADKYLADRENMAAEAAHFERVHQYVNAVQNSRAASYWWSHLVEQYGRELIERPYQFSNILHEILANERTCACGRDHAGNKRAAANYGITPGPDASRVAVPEGVPAAKGQPSGASRDALAHERPRDSMLDRHATPLGRDDRDSGPRPVGALPCHRCGNPSLPGTIKCETHS